MPISIAPRVELSALPGLPIIQPGDDLAELLWHSLERAGVHLCDGDVLTVSSKLASRAEGRFVDLSTVQPGARAIELAGVVNKQPALVELILSESVAISRASTGVLIVRHRLGFISANAAIDNSNASPVGPGKGHDDGPWVLLIPEDPDRTAAHLRAALERRADATIGVIITDSLGRPFRVGTVGAAIGVAGVPAVNDLRGQTDLDGRELQYTVTALADQIAAAADLVAGQAGEGRGAVHVRGVTWNEDARSAWGTHSAEELQRSPEQDLYA